MYMAWDEALFPHETVLPVLADNLLAFCKSLSDMGYSYHTILSMYFSGVWSWVSSIYLFIYLFILCVQSYPFVYGSPRK